MTPEITGLELITKERERQIEQEHYTAKHDDDHANSDLAIAAACYASPYLIYIEKRYMDGIHFENPWPWDHESDKRRIEGRLQCNTPFVRSRDERLRQLAKAGALIAAEIDRLLRRQAEQP